MTVLFVAFIVSGACAILCAVGWWRASAALFRTRKALGEESWMHAACLSIAEGRPCSADDGAVTASLATRTVFSLRQRYDKLAIDLRRKLPELSQANTFLLQENEVNIRARQNACIALDDSRKNADRLAACVRAYVLQMDEFSMKLGEPPCALSREREALSLHQKLNETQPCPTNPA